MWQWARDRTAGGRCAQGAFRQFVFETVVRPPFSVDLPFASNSAQLSRCSWFPVAPTRRGGRVVECTCLESRRTRKGTEGSNPSLSATFRNAKGSSSKVGDGGVDRKSTRLN